METRRILKGVTGRTTAKLTSQHGLKHDHLISTRRVASGGGQVYASDAQGALHAVSAACSHQGCVVAWSSARSHGAAPATDHAIRPQAGSSTAPP